GSRAGGGAAALARRFRTRGRDAAAREVRAADPRRPRARAAGRAPSARGRAGDRPLRRRRHAHAPQERDPRLMVRLPRFGRLRLPPLRPNWRARLRAQRAWWRRRLRTLAGDHEVLFPEAGGGVVAIETLAAGAGPRIAILHATAGSGHKSAAVAIAQALGELAPDATVREVDALVFASRFYRSTYAQGYNAMAQRAPRLWGALYALWAQQRVNRSAGPAREALDRLALRGLVRVVERERPDAIVCTHFLPVEALYPIRGRGRLDVPLHVVITDFTA